MEESKTSVALPPNTAKLPCKLHLPTTVAPTVAQPGLQCLELAHDDYNHTKCVLERLREFSRNASNFLWPEALPVTLMVLQESIMFLLDHKDIEEAGEHTVAILSNLLHENLNFAWENLNETYRPSMVSVVFDLIEALGLKYGEIIKPNGHGTIRTPKLEMRIFRLDIEYNFTFAIRDEWEHGRITVTQEREKDVVACLYYFHDISHLITTLKRKNVFHIQSELIGLTLSSKEKPENVIITFKKEEDSEHPLSNDSCVFWNASKIDHFYFDSSGCWLLGSRDNLTICECNHLTTFAVLTNWRNIELMHNKALTILTIIGCSISSFALLACITIFTVARSLWSSKTTMHNNLCLCLLMGNITLMVGLKSYSNRLACVIVTAVLHFSYLSAFMWMLLEGISIFRAVVTVFHTDRKRTMEYYLFGYGISLSVVALTIWFSFLLDLSYVSLNNICWLNSENHLIWTFLGPAALIITINFIVLGITLKKAQNLKSTLRHSQYKKVKSVARGIAVLSPLLGLTWISGFLFVNDHLIVFAYIFTILNSLQGVFIFIFHFWMNKNIQKIILNPDIILKANEMKRKLWLKRDQSQSTRTSSLNSDPSTSSSRRKMEKLEP